MRDLQGDTEIPQSLFPGLVDLNFLHVRCVLVSSFEELWSLGVTVVLLPLPSEYKQFPAL